MNDHRNYVHSLNSCENNTWIVQKRNFMFYWSSVKIFQVPFSDVQNYYQMKFSLKVIVWKVEKHQKRNDKPKINKNGYEWGESSWITNDSLGAFHSTENSSLHFGKFPVANGTLFSGISGKEDNLVRNTQIFKNLLPGISIPFHLPLWISGIFDWMVHI